MQASPSFFLEQIFADIYGHGHAYNDSATGLAETAIISTQVDAAVNGTGFLSIGFSGGAQANLDAFGRLGLAATGANTAFLDPGLGAGSSIPAGVNVYRGGQDASPYVNRTSPGGNTISIPQCGHDAVCLINNGGASLSQAIAAAGACSNPTLFVKGKSPTPLHAGGGGGGRGGFPFNFYIGNILEAIAAAANGDIGPGSGWWPGGHIPPLKPR